MDVVLVPEDLDGDGLPDIKETGGYRDGYGRWHYTDPNAVDTDGDGLSDSYEAGFSFTVDGKTYHKSRSDPTKVDTDGDGLDDFWEDYWGTDAYNEDTDGDGLLDGEDDQPLVPANPIGDLIVERLRQEVALRLGGLFGETGLEGEKFNYLVRDWAAHPYYALGWIASGIAVYGDVRDFAYAVSQADTVGAAINGIGLLPYLGDCSKTAADVAKYLVKYPDNLLEIGRLLADQRVIQLLPDEGQLNVIDHFYLSATGRRVGTELATEYGLTGALVAKIQGRGVKLDEITHVFKVGENAIPLKNEQFTHALNRHVYGTEDVRRPGTTIFPTPEPVTSYGVPYPGTSTLTRAQMEGKLIQWADEVLRENHLTEWPRQSKNPTYSPVDAQQYGIDEIGVGINPKTGVATIYPTKGPQVFMWYKDKWNPTV